MPPAPASDRRPTFATPFVWAAGGLLLTLTFWLPGVVAFFRTLVQLFR